MLEMPSLKQFSQLRKLGFTAINEQSLLNALEAPSIEEMHLGMNRKKLKKCLNWLKDYQSLKKLTITSFSLEELYIGEDEEAMEYVGLPQCDWYM